MQVPVRVEVVPSKKSDNSYGWGHEVDDDKYKGFWGLKFKKSYGDEFLIEFWLDAAHNLRFVEDYPFSVRPGWGWFDCPERGQIEGPFKLVSWSPYSIKVENTNPLVKKYCYRLEFIETIDGKERTVVWDPIVDNQNGNGHNILALAVNLVLGVAVLAGVAAAFMALLALSEYLMPLLGLRL